MEIAEMKPIRLIEDHLRGESEITLVRKLARGLASVPNSKPNWRPSRTVRR